MQRLNANGIFTIVFGAALLASAISATPEEVWAAQDSDSLPTINAKLSLTDAIHLAYQDNISLAQARADGAAARAAANRTRAAAGPNVSTTTYASTGDSSNILTSPPGSTPTNIFAVPSQPFIDQDLMLMAPLTTGGALHDRSSAASAQSSAAQSTVAANALTVRDAVTDAYVAVLLQNALTDAADSRLTDEQEQVRISSEKVNAGNLAPVDLLREQAELADAQQGATQAQINVQLALVDLRSALGVSQESDIQITGTLDSPVAAPIQALPGTLADALQGAARNRPELAAAQQEVAAANADLSAARGEYAPQVYGVAMADSMANDGAASRTGYTIGLTASVPLYDGGARQADVDAAKAKLDRAEADAMGVREAVEKQVAQAWYAQQGAQQQVASAQAGLSVAQQDYDLADLRYNAGKSTTADRLDALAALTRAQAALAQARAAQVVSESDLSAAVGNPD